MTDKNAQAEHSIARPVRYVAPDFWNDRLKVIVLFIVRPFDEWFLDFDHGVDHEFH